MVKLHKIHVGIMTQYYFAANNKSIIIVKKYKWNFQHGEEHHT